MEKEMVVFLNDVVDAISTIEENLQGIGFSDFRTDRKRLISVVNSFESIFDSVNKLPSSTKEIYPEIPWEEFYEFQTKLSPKEYGIDEEIVWSVAKNKLTRLKKIINKSFFK